MPRTPRALLAPLMTGLLTRDNPINPRHILAPAYKGYIGRVNAYEMMPSPGVFNAAPVEHHLQLAEDRDCLLGIRFYFGGEAPEWYKHIGGPALRIYNPTDQRYATVGRWWLAACQTVYESAIEYLKQYDQESRLCMVSISLGSLLYAEPFLRSLPDDETYNTLKRAGLTTANDHSAMKFAVQVHKNHLRRVRSFLTFNPGQDFDHRRQDEAWSNEMMDYIREVFPRRAVFFNTSLGSEAEKPPAYQRMYEKMKVLGPPMACQTEQPTRIHDVRGMMQYALGLGFHGIETPPVTFDRIPNTEVLQFSKNLVLNAPVGL